MLTVILQKYYANLSCELQCDVASWHANGHVESRFRFTRGKDYKYRVEPEIIKNILKKI
jgi:hypothetical protein